MRKAKTITVTLFFAIILSISISALATHGGQTIGTYFGNNNYLSKYAKWTASFDKEILDLKITDWSWASSNSDMMNVEITDTTYSYETATIMKTADVTSPWFSFTVKENAQPGQYLVTVVVTDRDGKTLDSWGGNYVVEPHQFDTVVDKRNSTCLVEGFIEYACECGVTRIETIPVLKHTVVDATGKEATCTEPGLTDGSNCSVCKTIIVAQKEIPALGHSWGEWVPAESGFETRVCANDETHTETRKILVPGDANDDMNVDIQDLLSIIDYIVFGTEPKSKINADANSDTEIDLRDLVWIVNHIVST